MRTQLTVAAFLLTTAGISTPGVALADPPSPTPGVATGAVEEVKQEAPPRFYGFTFDYSLYDSSGLNAQNYSNLLTMYFEPSWQLGKQFFRGTRFSRLTLAGRFVLTRALQSYDEANASQYSDSGPVQPCSNLTPSTQGGSINPAQVQRCPYNADYRWDQSDVWLTLKNPKIYTIPKLEVNLNPSLRVILPTSIESQYASLYFAASGSLGLNRSFFNDKLTVGYSFGATKYFHQYTTPGVNKVGAPVQGIVDNYSSPSFTNFYADPTRVATTGTAGQPGYNPDFSFSHIFSVDLAPTDKLSFSLLYILIDAFSYEAKCGTQQYGNVMTDPCANANNVAKDANGVGTAGRKISDTQVFWVTAGYQLTDWLNLSLAWITWAPLRHPDNSYRQAIISADYNAYTSINLGATVSLEKAAARFF